jgi:1-phosphofructokinase family hexose kinase
LIVTLTANPAIDRTLTVDRLAFEDRAYVHSTRDTAGGRGINASCVIHSFGGQSIAVFPCGGNSGKRLEQYLNGRGVPIAPVPVRNPIRTNFTVTDQHGLTVNLNETGPSLSRAEVSRLEQAVLRHLNKASWLMICGSLPPGVPPDFYGRIIAAARKRKVRTLLDADGAPLRAGIDAGPTVVAPNQQEAERLLGRTLLTRTTCLEAAEDIRALGAEMAVLSIGSRGAIGSLPGGIYEAVPPSVEAVCPIGAGDAMRAAFAWSMERKPDRPADALRWGVAAGTASSRLPGMNLANLPQAEEIYHQVEVRRVE